jgi:carbamoyltransferase
MTILGISAFYHDSAAAIIVDGEIIAAAQEERFTRKKFDASFPKHAVEFCLNYAGTSLNKLDAIVFYDKPFLKFERLLETYYNFSPRGVKSFITSMPVWIKEKIFLRKVITEEFDKIEKLDRKKVKLLFPEHHLSHAASAYYPSPFQDSAILTIDAVGEWATASICKGEGNNITILKQLDFPHSLGLLYSAFTYFLGFKVNSGEYKLMGLAPYGIPGSEEVARFVDIIKKNLVDLKDDGSLFLNQEYFNYAVGLTMVKEEKWKELFGFPARGAESNLDQHHCNLALAIQQVTEEAVINLANEAKRLTNSDNLCMAGGVSLNCVANGKLDELKIFKNIFITPAAGDAGGALGAALAAYHIYFEQPRKPLNGHLDHLSGSFLGPEYSSLEVNTLLRKYNAAADEYTNENELTQRVAELIADGAVIGWHQGRMEFGPRALGARSIIADARNSTMQKKLNLKIKYREGFRPFAPIVLAEDVSEYFNQSEPSPYMLLVKPVKKNRQIPYPDDFKENGLLDKLYFLRSDIPAVTHIDYSARLQTVHKETNPRLWNLLSTFKNLTGYSVLVNTSFNVRGEPIVNTPEDAYRCFMRTDMDYLVIGNFIFDKKKQPKWEETKDWRTEFVLD